MRKIILWIFMCMFNNMLCKSQTIQKIQLDYADFSIMTCFDITPSYFDQGYLKLRGTATITDSVQIKTLATEMLKQKEIKDKVPSFDVRGKIIFMYADRNDSQVYYFDRFYVLHKNTYYKMSDELRRQILVIECAEEEFFSTDLIDNKVTKLNTNITNENQILRLP